MPLSDEQREKLERLPAEDLSGLFYRASNPKRQPLELLPIAKDRARWHRAGNPWPAYSGDSEVAAMYELARYTVLEPGVPPVKPVRRLSELHVAELRILNLASDVAQTYLDLAEEELTAGHGDDDASELCREIADVIRARRPEVEGLLVPSAAVRGARVLVIFPHGFSRVAVGNQRIGSLGFTPEDPPKPPPR